MKLTDLLCKLDYECIQGSTDLEVGQVVYDSRKITEGCLFICIAGANLTDMILRRRQWRKGPGC